MTELVKRYRQNAERCLRLIQNFNDSEAKRSLLAMANAWLMLAAQREKNIKATPAHEPIRPTDEPPPPPHEPPTIEEPPTPPPIEEPPPAIEPPQRLNTAKSDDPVQS